MLLKLSSPISFYFFMWPVKMTRGETNTTLQTNYTSIKKTRGSLHTGIPHFLKVRFMPLCFYGRPTLVTVSANQEKSEEDFAFTTKKTWKTKTVLSVCFAGAITGAAHPSPSSFPGTTLNISAASPEV